MPNFEYRATDPAGKLINGIMEAEAERGVVSKLHEMGYIPLGISLPGESPTGAIQAHLGLLFRERISHQELLHFTQELSTLLGAGLPLDRSLSVLSNLVEGAKIKKTVRLLLEGVRAGKSLSLIMAEYPDVFPKLYVNMVRAGEIGGVLESVLRFLAEYLERSIELREDLKSALTYPLSLAGVAGLSLIVLFVYVIPKFSLMFKDAGEALPWITSLVIGFSVGLSSYGWIVLLMFLLGGIGGYFVTTQVGITLMPPIR